MNFKKLKVEIAFGQFKELDIAEALGNYIHSNTPDIGLDDVARNIYYSKDEIDIQPEHADMIVAMVQDKRCMLVAGIKKAIIGVLTEK